MACQGRCLDDINAPCRNARCHDCNAMNLWLATLQWYAEVGVDEAVAETPWDRFANPQVQAKPSKPPPQPSQAPRSSQTSAAPPPPPRRTAIAGLPTPALDSELAEIADLDALRARLDTYEGCALKLTATNTVFGSGSTAAEVMIIGEAPGAEEDRQGEPFVGASGRLLDRMLAAIGRDRSGVYIANTLYWRPPGNRTPTPAEIQACLPFLRRQIAIVRPQVLLLVGGAAAKTMLSRSEGIMRLRGRWFEYEGGEGQAAIPALPTFHPAYLLRSPAQKREAWRDLLALRAHLDSR